MKDKRPEILENAPLQYAPENELGVVFLFSHIAKKLRLTQHKLLKPELVTSFVLKTLSNLAIDIK